MLALALQPLAPQLAVLELGRNANGKKGAAALGALLPGAIRLSHLFLDSCDMGAAEMQAFAAALGGRAMPFITSLDLSHNKFGSAGGPAALADAFSSSLTNLRGLKLEGCGFNAAGFSALAPAVQGFKNITDLHLAHNELGEGGAIALAQALPGLASLHFLILDSCSIAAAAMAALAPALRDHARGLEGVSLSGNAFGIGGANALAAALPRLSALKRLDL